MKIQSHLFKLLILSYIFSLCSGCATYMTRIPHIAKTSGINDVNYPKFRLLSPSFNESPLNSLAREEYSDLFSDDISSIPIVIDDSLIRNENKASLARKIYNGFSIATLGLVPRVNTYEVTHDISMFFPMTGQAIPKEETLVWSVTENESLFPLGLIPVGKGKYHVTTIFQTAASEMELSSIKVKEIKEDLDLEIVQRIIASINNLDKKTIDSFSDETYLMNFAMNATHPATMRLIAMARLESQASLMEIADKAQGYEMRKAALNRLSPASLINLSNSASTLSARLAALIITEEKSWSDVFASTPPNGSGLGELLTAVTLVDSPLPDSSDVVNACHKFIKQGNEARVPELRFLLLKYGDKRLAEDYLNCGHSGLATVAQEWANLHGYSKGTGYGSHRVRWGSSR